LPSKTKPETFKQNMRKTVLIDDKRIINPNEAEKYGITYYGIG